MVVYNNVYSTADIVEELEINDESVIVRSGITQVNEEGTEENPGFEGYVIEKEVHYDKNEYIRLMNDQNTTLEATVDSILTEVIPAMFS